MDTAEIIKDAFWELLAKKPYNKITVKDIVELCHVNRNTFYYHYSDISDLLEGTFEKWADEIISSGRANKALEETLAPLIESFINYKKELLNIYKNMDREIYMRSLDQLCTYIIDSYVSQATLNVDISDEEITLVKRLYKCAIVGIIIDWLDSEMAYDLLDSVIHIHELFNEKGLITFIP